MSPFVQQHQAESVIVVNGGDQTSPSRVTGEAEHETSAASPKTRIDEKSKNEFLEAAFADAIAIYLLSLAIDFDYSELREREYPLLAPKALAERLQHIARLFPPNPGYEFAIKYRRRA